MVDWLVAWGVKSAASFAFKEVLLPLAKGGIEDYAKDALKEKIEDVVKDEHRTAVGKALKEFLSLFQDELQGAEDDLTLAQIETQFGGAVKQCELVRYWAIRGIIESAAQDPDLLQLLIDRARFDVDDDIRAIALKEISKGYRDYEGRFELLCDRAMNDPSIEQDEDKTNPRYVGLFALARQYPERAETRLLTLCFIQR